MKNVKIDIKKNIATITVDLSADFGPSKSGKTIMIATTEGNQKLTGGPNGDVFLGLNLYRR